MEKPAASEVQYAGSPEYSDADARPVPRIHAKTILLVIVCLLNINTVRK